jgi:signal transduction histidine kinase
VLLQAFPDHVEVSVRDEGPGIPDGRVAEAEQDGRLGIAGSIRGRILDLGGTAELITGGTGTEWELTVPRG